MECNAVDDRSPWPGTKVWEVVPDDWDKPIGSVRWHNSWNCYVFRAGDGMALDARSLRQLAVFCEQETALLLAKREKG